MGKSSLLNSLKRTRVAQVGNTPGVTRAVQEVVLDKHLRLLDSPGIVFADSDSSPADAASQALRNCVKVSAESTSTPVTWRWLLCIMVLPVVYADAVSQALRNCIKLTSHGIL